MLPHTLPAKLSTYQDYLNYLENIAYRMVDHTGSAPGDVRRFYTRVDDIMGTNLTYPLMCVIAHPVSYPGERDALFEAFEFDIWIVKNYGSDPKKIPLLIDECKTICDDIISKLEHDSNKPIGDIPFTYFELPNLEGEALDALPFPDKVTGWSNKVKIGNQKAFKYDAAKWE